MDFDDEPDQEKRIEKLKAELERLGGAVSDNPDLSLDMEEQFLKHILAFESTNQLSLLQWLENAGLEVPSPEQLTDAQLRDKLWEIIDRMASLGAYLHSTNHLSDRELYRYLITDALREETVLPEAGGGGGWHISPIGGCSEEDNEIYLRYYADDESRKGWRGDSDEPLPPKEKLPYDRDRLLPGQDFSGDDELSEH